MLECAEDEITLQSFKTQSFKIRPMLKKLLFTFLSVIFISVFAQIEIVLPLNVEGISITGQTFAILLAAFFLGRWYGLLAVVIYIVIGAMGLPVFSGGSYGLEKLSGGTGGYFVGFILAAYRVGHLGEKGWRKSFPKSLQAMFYGTLIILLFGVLRLSFKYGFPKAMEIGFYPFLWGGLIKIILGAVIAYLIERFLKFE